MQLVLDALTVIFEVLSGLIYALEEVHHVSEPNVDLQFIDVFEYFSRLYLAVDVEADLWPIEAEPLFVHYHHFGRGF